MKIKKIKKFSLFFLKAFSAFCVAYVLAFVGKELLSYGTFSFIFLLISISMAFFYLIKPYGFFIVLCVDIGLILFALLLRFYIISAYGS